MPGKLCDSEGWDQLCKVPFLCCDFLLYVGQGGHTCHINFIENDAPELLSREQGSPFLPHIQASLALLNTRPSSSLASYVQEELTGKRDFWKTFFLSFQ